MLISLIAAMDKNRVIGKKNTLPWYLPADLRHFRNITMGKPVIMGRKTHKSIGRPLPGRTNIILTRDHNFSAEGCVITHSTDAAIKAANGTQEVVVIGGAEIYQQFLPLVQKMYLTMIDTELDGDTYFPEWNPAQWQEISCDTHKLDEKNKYPYTFLALRRIN